MRAVFKREFQRYSFSMSHIFVFGDEAGNFDFNDKEGASKYFIVGTVTASDVGFGCELINIRRELAWQGIALDSSFHASEDTQVVRDAVFRTIADYDFRVDITIIDKRKTEPKLYSGENTWEDFYKFAWHYHFKYVAKQITDNADDLLVAIASIGTKGRRKAIRTSLEDVISQSAKTPKWKVAFWSAESDPCLQVTDYCIWAIQRKWERGDIRSYNTIKDKIESEFDLFKSGKVNYY